MTTSTTFYRRELPQHFIPFSSREGRALFQEALADGTLESYFPLSEQFHTQADPSFCGLGSLVVALNALAIDPGRLWKGPWRWFDESLLDCCVPLEQVRSRGLTIGELSCLATCNGARSRLVYASNSDVSTLRETVLEASRSAKGPMVIASYDRSALGQTGSGHFSPVAAYHRARDLALVLDVARFKYPPHWVSVSLLFEAMIAVDPQSKRSRGWISLSSDTSARPILFSLGLPAQEWRPIVDELQALVRARADVDPVEAWIRAFAAHPRSIFDLVSPITSRLAAAGRGADLAPEHAAKIDTLLTEVRATRAFETARSVLDPSSEPLSAEVVAVLALVLARSRLDIEGAFGPALETEVSALSRQLDALTGGCR